MSCFRAPVASFKVRVPEGAYEKVMAAMVSAVAAMPDYRADREKVMRLAQSLLMEILTQMRNVHNYREKDGFPQPVGWQDVPADRRVAYQKTYAALFKQTYSGVAIAYGERYIPPQHWLVGLDAEH